MGYKLYYFDVRYFAEPARMMFHAAGVDFEDITWTFNEWPQYQKKAPFGKAPWLEVDGHTISESWAVNRFLAKRFGFNGKNEFEEALIDSTAHFLRSHLPDVMEYFYIVAGFKQGDADKVYKEKTTAAVELIFSHVKKLLDDADSGYILKSGISWIDLVLAENVILFNSMLPEFKGKYPDAIEYQQRVHNHPTFKKFADTRKNYRIGYLNNACVADLEK